MWKIRKFGCKFTEIDQLRFEYMKFSPDSFTTNFDIVWYYLWADGNGRWIVIWKAINSYEGYSSSLNPRFEKISQPLNSFLHTLTSEAWAWEYPVFSIDGGKFQNLSYLFGITGPFHIAFVGVEQVRYCGHNLLILQQEFELATGDIYSQSIGSIYNKYDTVNSIRGITCVFLPEITIFWLARHVEHLEINTIASESLLLEPDCGSDLSIHFARVNYSG